MDRHQPLAGTSARVTVAATVAVTPSRDLDEATSDADEGDSDNDNHMDEPPAKRQKQEEVDAVWNDKSAGLRLISADDVVFHVPAYHLQSARCVEPGMGLGT